MEHRALLRRCRALLWGYTALYHGDVVGCKRFGILCKHLPRHIALVWVFCGYGLFVENFGLFRWNTGLFWVDVGLFWVDVGLFCGVLLLSSTAMSCNANVLVNFASTWCIALGWVNIALSDSKAHLSGYTALLSGNKVPLSDYENLLSSCRALLSGYRFLWSICMASIDEDVAYSASTRRIALGFYGSFEWITRFISMVIWLFWVVTRLFWLTGLFWMVIGLIWVVEGLFWVVSGLFWVVAGLLWVVTRLFWVATGLFRVII